MALPGAKMVEDKGRVPLDLPQLRLWIGHLIESYDALVDRNEVGYSQQEIRRYRSSLASAALACDGEFERPAKARVRELLALGAANYGLTGEVPRETCFSEQMVIDFAVFSLWPLVIAPKLPRAWLDAFIDITRCIPLATLVVHARSSRGTSDAMSAHEFGQALAGISFPSGIRNLLHDLSDPRRGGCALTGMAIAGAGYAPRRGASPKRVAKWALLAAIGGVTGNRADDALSMMSDWLAEQMRSPGIQHPDSAHPGSNTHHDSGKHLGIVHAINHLPSSAHVPDVGAGGSHHSH
jgi:hypothetical protein